MPKHLTILNTGITVFCIFNILRILFSTGGPWGWGYMLLWIFPLIWIIAILLDQVLKSIIKDKVILNVTGAILLGIFLFITYT